jgi:hypothetical protein
VSSDPIAFAEARLDDDEHAARELIEGTGMHGLLRIFADGSPVLDMLGRRMLREVESGRRILERHRPDAWGCQSCAADGPCPDLRDLLCRWADRPGYDPDWAPAQSALAEMPDTLR